MLLSINLIPKDDVDTLIKTYKTNKVEELILSGKIEEAPSSVVDFIIANNLLIDKVKIPIYKLSDIILADNLSQLSNLLQLDFPDQDSIIRILTYLNKLVNDSNIFNTLPEETLINIMNNLSCHSLLSLSKISDRLKSIIDKYKLIERAKKKGFPRQTGHCHTHNVKQYVIKYGLNFAGIIEHLDKRNTTLVRGDLIFTKGFDIYRNDGVYIFDGCQIIPLDYTQDDYGALPKEFKVINDGVPIDYWVPTNKERGIEHNGVLWFDPSNVRQQLINNVKEEEIGEAGGKINYEISSKFIYDKKEYTILYDGDDVFKFLNILKTTDILMFDNGDNAEYYKHNILLLR